jgi:hypothetical protein
MSPISHAFNEYSLVGTVIKLAQSTFQQTMPATLPAEAMLPPQAAPREGIISRALAAIDGFFYRQQMKEREAYLGQAQDIFDLENRLRQLDRRPYF